MDQTKERDWWDRYYDALGEYSPMSMELPALIIYEDDLVESKMFGSSSDLLQEVHMTNMTKSRSEKRQHSAHAANLMFALQWQFSKTDIVGADEMDVAQGFPPSLRSLLENAIPQTGRYLKVRLYVVECLNLRPVNKSQPDSYIAVSHGKKKLWKITKVVPKSNNP